MYQQPEVMALSEWAPGTARHDRSRWTSWTATACTKRATVKLRVERWRIGATTTFGTDIPCRKGPYRVGHGSESGINGRLSIEMSIMVLYALLCDAAISHDGHQPALHLPRLAVLLFLLADWPMAMSPRVSCFGRRCSTMTKVRLASSASAASSPILRDGRWTEA